ncbi:endonuclease NucS [Bifidobacterium asteroides]|uniref:Endonuclease NucS n=1 Tax=Bifidobacterium asteroides TaxID=1684 RepID=A0A318LZY5_9BIFI|nr:endonuclease NucS [Bifidobacterium asteroides]PXY81457.1 endonuclease NucS [Bifidobacterium asteroides]
MRIIVADCSAEYSGRLNASLPPARRVLLIKADMSCLIFSELGSYKPLNWMCAPCTIREIEPEETGKDGAGIKADPVAGTEPDEVVEAAAPDALIAQEQEQNQDQCRPVRKVLRVSAVKSSDVLTIRLYQIYADDSYDLGTDPGLVKDGVEAHLQRYLAEQIDRIGPGATLVRREYPTPIGPVDIMAVDGQGQHVAIEIKRHGGIDGVEQLTRYCRLLNRDPLLAPVRGIFAAQTITPQARVLAEDRGFECLILDYEAMKGADSNELTLF